MTVPGPVTPMSAWDSAPRFRKSKTCGSFSSCWASSALAGGKVVGHFQVYFPEEIVHAAGLLPFKVRGASIEPQRADSRFGSYLCSILKTSLELALSNRVRAALIYPIAVPAVCFLIALFVMPETRHMRIWGSDKQPAHAHS